MPTIDENMTSDIYHAHPNISASDVIKINNSGLAAWEWAKLNPEEDTSALIFGRLTHLLLEAAIKDVGIADLVAVAPDLPKTSNANKMIHQSFEEANQGKLIASAKDFEHATRLLNSLKECPQAWSLFAHGKSEVSIFGKIRGLDVKTRPDYIRLEDGICINFKTCSDASEAGFLSAVREHSYDWQSAFYCQTLEAVFGKPFTEIHVCVEKTPKGGPANIGIYTLPDEALALARTAMAPLLDKLVLWKRGFGWEEVMQLTVPDFKPWHSTKARYAVALESNHGRELVSAV